jgi:peptidylprolyl isomerase
MERQGFDRFKLDRFKFDHLRHWLKTGATLLLMMILSLGLSAASRPANIMPAGNPITDGKALLRYSLPIDNAPVRELQGSLEDIATQLRANRRWGAIAGDVKRASWILRDKEPAILASVPEAKQAEAQALLAKIKDSIAPLQESIEAKDKEQTFQQRSELLDLVGQLEESMVQSFPFEVPAAYNNLPQLKGRATIAFTTNKGKITAVVDGYSAPVTAGNFVDLVQRGFYDGLPFHPF